MGEGSSPALTRILDGTARAELNSILLGIAQGTSADLRARFRDNFSAVVDFFHHLRTTYGIESPPFESWKPDEYDHEVRTFCEELRSQLTK